MRASRNRSSISAAERLDVALHRAEVALGIGGHAVDQRLDGGPQRAERRAQVVADARQQRPPLLLDRPRARAPARRGARSARRRPGRRGRARRPRRTPVRTLQVAGLDAPHGRLEACGRRGPAARTRSSTSTVANTAGHGEDAEDRPAPRRRRAPSARAEGEGGAGADEQRAERQRRAAGGAATVCAGRPRRSAQPAPTASADQPDRRQRGGDRLARRRGRTTTSRSRLEPVADAARRRDPAGSSGSASSFWRSRPTCTVTVAGSWYSGAESHTSASSWRRVNTRRGERASVDEEVELLRRQRDEPPVDVDLAGRRVDAQRAGLDAPRTPSGRAARPCGAARCAPAPPARAARTA